MVDDTKTGACRPEMGPARPWTCLEAASGLREEQARAGRDILAGVCTTQDGLCIAAYGDTGEDVAALPATFRGFRVLADLSPVRPTRVSHVAG